MIQKRTILLPMPKAKAAQILKNHIQHRFIRDAVCENIFRLHICVARTANRAFLLLDIKGTLEEYDHGTRVSYIIRPTYPAILVALLLFVTLLEGLITLCIGTGSAVYTLIGLLLNIVYQGSILWQEHTCMKRFEGWFVI